MTNLIETIKNKVLQGIDINFDEAITISRHQPLEELLEAANEIRKHYVGDSIDMCSIINARSGLCNADCKWCAQSMIFKTNVKRYDVVDKSHALKIARQNDQKGVDRMSLVTSGIRLNDRQLTEMLDIFAEMKKQTNLSLCASFGLINKNQLKKLKEAGITRYQCNLETSREFFPNLVSTHTYDEKIQTLKDAREAGLSICSGGIFGMGETMEDRIKLAFELRNLGVLSIPLNILMPIKDTPLENAQPLTEEEILRSFALFRFINPRADIRLAGGRMKIMHIIDKVLKSGINAALVGDLLTTIGSNIDEDKQIFTEAGFRLKRVAHPQNHKIEV